MTLNIGDLAPDFEAETTEGRISFYKWIGNRWCVLFSHPDEPAWPYKPQYLRLTFANAVCLWPLIVRRSSKTDQRRRFLPDSPDRSQPSGELNSKMWPMNSG